MNSSDTALDALSRRERSTLRALMIRAVAVAGRRPLGDDIGQLMTAAPVERLPAAAALHRVTGSVLTGIGGDAGLPSEVLRDLQVRRRQSLLHHLLITAELANIGRAFDASGTAWVAMKGPVVAARLYQDAGDRTYGDLDLLVGRRDFPTAVQTLESLGFSHSIRNWALAEQILAGQVEMIRGSARVDLHWHLHYSAYDRRPYALDPDAMVARSRRIAVSGVSVPTLDPVDTLLTLAFHAARSGGHRLVWMKDIERAVSVESPDLDELVRRCRAYHCAPPVGIMLRRAKALVQADIPDDIVRALTNSPLRAADRLVVALVDPVQFHERPTATRAFTRSVRSSALASLSAGPRRGVRRLKRRLLPPAENETDDPFEKERYLRAVAASDG